MMRRAMMHKRRAAVRLLTTILVVCTPAFAQSKPRARDLGVPFDGTPGALDSITDIKGIEVGYATLISGEGKLVVGKGPVRTGVTALFPRGHASS
ncbi:MAG: P1 family peptidase, partial [Terriglobales bacterium]